jgi:hypothetical protein
MSRMGGKRGGRKPRDTFYPGFHRTDSVLATVRKSLREYGTDAGQATRRAGIGSNTARSEANNAPVIGQQPASLPMHIDNDDSATVTLGKAADMGGVIVDFFFIRGSRSGSGQLRLWFSGSSWSAAVIRIDPENPGIAEPPVAAEVGDDLTLTLTLSDDTDPIDLYLIYIYTRRIA